MAATRHVVLVTYGEPPTPAFVDHLVYSWRILVGLTRKIDAIPKPLLPLIALARARGRWQSWRLSGYRSPLEPITERQADVLRGLLSDVDPGETWRVQVAYEYRRPLLADLLSSLPPDEPAWIVPLYAADSAFTHALSREAVHGRSRSAQVLDALPPEVLGDASAAHVLELTGREPGWQGSDVALVLAAHGTVLAPSTPLDTGREATEALCTAIAARLAGHFGVIVNGWLNHTRGGRWTEPPIAGALKQVADAGYSRVVYFPYGFLGDNAETELEGRVALEHEPSLQALHLPCLNDSPRLLRVIASQLRQSALTPSQPEAVTMAR